MPEEITLIKSDAQTYYIRHPEHSYAIFMINDKGDLMINSDWGISCYAWRSYAGTFKQFLIDLNESYWKQKMQYNLNAITRRIPKRDLDRFTDNVWPIFQELQKILKSETIIL